MHSFIYVHEYCIYTREMAHSTQCEKAKMFGRGPGAHLVIDGHFSCAYKTHFFSCLFLPASIWFRLYNSSEGGANRHKCDAAECSFGWRKTWRSQSGHKQSVFWAKHEAWIIIRNRVHHGFQFSCLYCLPFHKSQIAHIFEMSQRRHKAQAHKKKNKILCSVYHACCHRRCCSWCLHEHKCQIPTFHYLEAWMRISSIIGMETENVFRPLRKKLCEN